MLMTWCNDSIIEKVGGAPSLPQWAIRVAVRHIAGLLGVACPVLLMSAADAATPVWQGAPIHYAVNGAPLPDVLRDVLAVEGMSTDIGREVKGPVNGRFDDTPGNVFIQLVEAYGLVWYFDGKAMHVATASDVRSRVIPFAPMTREAVASLLRNLDLDDPRLPIKYSATTVKVAGPSKFVDAVADAIDKAQRQTTVDPSFDETVIRVFPLRYAQAQDVRYTVGAQEQVVLGIASLLRRLMSDTWQATTPRITRTRTDERASERRTRGGPPPLPSLLGIGLGSVSPEGEGERVPLPDSDTAQPAVTQARRNIVADQRSNAVVISDLVSMMPNYERAIAMLDQPQELVEIDALVIDVSSNAARSLGVRWGGANGRINGAVGTASAPLSIGAAALTTPASAMTGLNLATLVGNSAQYLFAQIQALEESGKARVLSRPQVLTLNNTEAALTSRSSVYVRVAGNQAVDLFNIDTGLTLKVTPSVESSGEPRRNIRLNIQIEDGTFNTSMAVDGIPRVDNHSVVTQAIVRDGESLLIGGYQYERSDSTTSKVPVLGDVPYLGALFRDTRTTRERFERLIMITPRLKRQPGGGESNVVPVVAGTTIGAASSSPDAIPAQVGVVSTLLRTPEPSPGSAAAGSAEPVHTGGTVAPNVEVGSRTLAQPAAGGTQQSSSPSLLSLPSLPIATKMPWENRHDR
ncbi:type III secretion system outer membrane ring subunit SctC [Caballeronia sp. LjRoot34]|uniref:type III secretion system outer membrane ring subunit SctC n=1 Tax=Caballeronia sp. LjRoot34 TaxID=3342325 RepID=UPI003ED02265